MDEKKMNPITNGNKNMNENVTSSLKKDKYEMGRNAAVGSMGGFAGGAAGAVLGSVISQEVNAQETEEIPVSGVVNPEPAPEPNPEPAPEPNPEPAPEPNPEPAPEPNPVPDPNSEVEVLDFKSDTTEDGQIIQEAVVSIDGQVVHFTDITNDDIIDLAATDINGDGTITEDEIFDISDEGLSMQPLRDAYQETQMIAQNDDIIDSDYINDANVDDYIA